TDRYVSSRTVLSYKNTTPPCPTCCIIKEKSYIFLQSPQVYLAFGLVEAKGYHHFYLYHFILISLSFRNNVLTCMIVYDKQNRRCRSYMNTKYILFAFFFTISFSSVAQQKIESYEQKIDGLDLSFTMTAIPAGEFTMGSDNGKPDEQPVHRVALDAFWMGTYEVTWDIFEPFLYRDYEETKSTSPV